MAAWLIAMIAAGGAMWRDKLTPVQVGDEPPGLWPAASTLLRRGDAATLLMLVHPQCPCTRASLAELGRLMDETRDRVRAYVLVVRPPGVPDSWARTELWGRAAAIPGVSVHMDLDGEEARRFGAVASGHVLVYDAAGRLRFRGGITGARGHEGDNPGRSRARAAILESHDAGEGPSFGCALLHGDEGAGRRDPRG